MKKLEKGFTLIELMIVVAIIAILAAVAAPRFGNQIKKAKDAKAVQIVGTWRSGYNMHYADGDGTYATAFGDLTDNVDTATVNKTFEGADLSEVLGTTTGTPIDTVYTAAGAVDSIQFTINDTNKAIEIETTGDAADGKPWNSK